MIVPEIVNMETHKSHQSGRSMWCSASLIIYSLVGLVRELYCVHSLSIVSGGWLANVTSCNCSVFDYFGGGGVIIDSFTVLRAESDNHINSLLKDAIHLSLICHSLHTTSQLSYCSSYWYTEKHLYLQIQKSLSLLSSYLNPIHGCSPSHE